MLRETLVRTYMPAALQLCPGADTPGRVAALTDFAYNCGVGNLRSSTLRKRVNAGDWTGAQVEIKKWCFAGGKRLNGLVKRREVEAGMLPQDYSANSAA